MSTPLKILTLVAFLALPLLIGLIGSMATMPEIPGWYAGLTKPALNPPSFVFGPVWTLLYLLMGFASYLVLLAFPKKGSVGALLVYKAHLFINLLWSVVFFGFNNPWGGVAVVLTLLGMIAYLIFAFGKISKLAAYLLVPYLLWVSFATYLNISIALLN